MPHLVSLQMVLKIFKEIVCRSANVFQKFYIPLRKVCIMRKINNIILHCSATMEGRQYYAKDIDKWHKAQGWNGIGYHYVIDLDGTVERGRSLDKTGAHCTGHNTGSIGICYIGGLDTNGKAKDTRTPQQKYAMWHLVEDLLNQLHLTVDNVHCHNQYANKACPCFNITDFKKEFKIYQDKEDCKV